ncbi:hypothetical protein KI387_008383, partial [Taxus chinensis]
LESGRCPRPKVPSPSLSGCAKEAQTTPSKSDVPDLKEENISEKKTPLNVPQQSSERNHSAKTLEQLEEILESMSTKELLSQESAPMVGEEVQQKPPGGERGPCDTSFGAMMQVDMYATQGYMQGFVPPVQSYFDFMDYMDYNMGTHNSGHVMSREDFEAIKVDMRKK